MTKVIGKSSRRSARPETKNQQKSAMIEVVRERSAAIVNKTQQRDESSETSTARVRITQTRGGNKVKILTVNQMVRSIRLMQGRTAEDNATAKGHSGAASSRDVKQL